MNCEVTVAGMAAPAPRVKGNTNAAHHTARFVLAARMPLLFPAHQVGSNGQFFAINILARLGDVEILAEELDRVHVQLGGEIVERTHGKNGSLRMVRSAPGPRRTDGVADRSVLLALVRDRADVGNRWSSSVHSEIEPSLSRQQCVITGMPYMPSDTTSASAKPLSGSPRVCAAAF